MQDESVVSIPGGRRFEGSTAPKAAKGVLVAFFAKDFLFELVLFLLVVRLLLYHAVVGRSDFELHGASNEAAIGRPHAVVGGRQDFVDFVAPLPQ